MKTIARTKVMLFFLLGAWQTIYALDIIYEPRTAYIIEKNNTIEGLLGTALINALEKSNLKYQLKNRPSKRHLLEIKANRKEVCAVGWFKNPQREKFGKYTKALYQDKPMGIITYKNAPIKDEISLDELFNSETLSVLLKDSFSYGKQIDEKLEKTKQKKYTVNTENSKMVFHILRKRADFMFYSYEEAFELFKDKSLDSKLAFKIIKDIPKGNKRYLICSQKVSDETISLINKNLD